MYETIISIALFAITLYTAANYIEPEPEEDESKYDPNKSSRKRTQLVRSYVRVLK